MEENKGTIHLYFDNLLTERLDQMFKKNAFIYLFFYTFKKHILKHKDLLCI